MFPLGGFVVSPFTISYSRIIVTMLCSLVYAPLGENVLFPTPLTTPTNAIFSTFTSFVSVNVVRPVIVPFWFSYSAVANAQNSARVMSC